MTKRLVYRGAVYVKAAPDDDFKARHERDFDALKSKFEPTFQFIKIVLTRSAKALGGELVESDSTLMVSLEVPAGEFLLTTKKEDEAIHLVGSVMIKKADKERVLGTLQFEKDSTFASMLPVIKKWAIRAKGVR